MHECCRSCIFLIISLKYVNMGISIPKDNGRAPKTTLETALKTAGKASLGNDIGNGAENAPGTNAAGDGTGKEKE